MASIVKKGEMQYQAQVRKKGYPPIYKTFEKKKDADDWAKQIESEMIRGVYVNRSEADSTLLDDALDRYENEVSIHKKSYESEKWRIAVWKRHKLASYALSSLRSTDFANHRDARLEEGISASTIRNELAIISHLFTIAIKEWNIPVTNPVLGIRKPRVNNARNRLLVKDEESRIISSIRKAKENAHNRANIWIEPLMIIAIETAARQAELVDIKWEDLHLEKCYVHFPKTKNGEERDVPLSETAVNLIQSLPKQNEKKVVQLDAIKKSKKEDPDFLKKVFKTTASALDQSWRRAILRARSQYEKELTLAGKTKEEIDDDKLLTNLHFHDLRHEGTTRLAEIFELHELMKVTGHKDTRMLARYYHPKASDLALKMRRVKI